jgi:hypothetical protein
MHNYKYKGSALRAREQTCVVFFSFFFRKNIPLALDTFEIFTHGICERRKSKSALRRRRRRRSSLETTFAASTLTGVKKVPYNLSLNLRTWRWTVPSHSHLNFPFVFVCTSITIAHVSSRSSTNVSCVRARALRRFTFYIIMLFSLSCLSSDKKKRRSTKRRIGFVRTSRLKVPL